MTERENAVPAASVIVPNLNGVDLLPECLGSLEEQTFRDYEAIVVDNGSTDGSEELVRNRFPGVRWIPLGTNAGFAAAVNEGIRQARGKVLVLLNSDTKAHPRWLERLLAAMDEVPGAAFAASKLLQFDPPHNIDAVGDGYTLPRASGFPIGRGEPGSEYNRRAWVFGACAAAAAYRRSMLDDIGVFDEDFFLTYEDIDFDLRAQVYGFRCLYVPDAIVYHKRGASTESWSAGVQARAIRNRIWAAGKNLPGPLLAVWWMAVLPRLAWVLLHVTLTGKHPAPRGIDAPRHRRAEATPLYLRELWRALRLLPSKRRAARSLRRLGSSRLLPALTPRHRPMTEDQN